MICPKANSIKETVLFNANNKSGSVKILLSGSHRLHKCRELCVTKKKKKSFAVMLEAVVYMNLISSNTMQ